MAEVRWSLTASQDLQELEDFIARDSVLHAVEFIDRIVESADRPSSPGISAIRACRSAIPLEKIPALLKGEWRGAIALQIAALWQIHSNSRCRHGPARHEDGTQAL
jgi:hypothetical protein